MLRLSIIDGRDQLWRWILAAPNTPLEMLLCFPASVGLFVNSRGVETDHSQNPVSHLAGRTLEFGKLDELKQLVIDSGGRVYDDRDGSGEL